MGDGVVKTWPRILLRAEGACIFGSTLWAYSRFGQSWWTFTGLLFIPDLGMVGVSTVFSINIYRKAVMLQITGLNPEIETKSTDEAHQDQGVKLTPPYFGETPALTDKS
jgi:hypothetical protein